MKVKLYKTLFFSINLLFISTLSAQKYDKKFTEIFSVNKDVQVAINAENTTIDVETWNKNKVAVEAYIEVEGLSKKEAEKYFKDWNFEALGNKNKVKITAKRQHIKGFNNDVFIFNSDHDFSFPEVVMPNFDSIHFPSFPEIDFIELPEIHEFMVIPEMDFDGLIIGLEDLEFDFDKYEEKGEQYFFQWKDSVNNITIKSKEEWEKFKKSDRYKKMKKKLEKNKTAMQKEFEKVKIQFKKSSKKDVQASLKKAKEAYKKIDKKKIKEEMEKARTEMTKARNHFIFKNPSGNLMVDGKKIKVKKRLVIKVPKEATFNLNTKHCKLNLPATKATGKVSYGTFNANALNGGDLSISFAPVNVRTLTKNTISLNNVTDASFHWVTNTKINANSSVLTIENIHKNIVINHKFGELVINKIHPEFNTFELLLNYSDAIIKLPNIKEKLTYMVGDKSPLYNNDPAITLSLLDLKKKNINGNFTINTADKRFSVSGKYSQLAIKEN